LCILSSGCGDKFWDPTQIGRFRPVPAVNVILDSLGVADEKPSQWENAEDPRPVDIMTFDQDYTFAPGDIIRVYIFELYQVGLPYINDFTVSESGRISLPEIGALDVVGLTEAQLEEEIRQILSPSILKEPLVTVTVMGSQYNTFTILGNGAPNPGRYQIPRYSFRLTDALAIASVAAQFNISYVYITRKVTDRDVLYGGYEQPKESETGEELGIPEDEMLEIIAPRAQVRRPSSRFIITTAEMSMDHDDLLDAALPEEFDNETARVKEEPVYERIDVSSEPQASTETGRIEWVFRDGKWVPVEVGKPVQKRKYEERIEEPQPVGPPREQIPAEFDWSQAGTGGIQTRVIKIPTDKLTAGDPRYNVIIRPGDVINVPLDVIGEFAIMGNVNNQGYINLTGRPMTLKMAVAAAGGLGPLAWPKRCEVTRRVGKNKEETVLVDLDKIAQGEEPDFFIKPNDLVNVGTHPTARFRAVLRNAFRATYGFGFIYDRNFADREFGLRHPLGPFGFGE
jgi:polysaccharide export outer membrane protein